MEDRALWETAADGVGQCVSAVGQFSTDAGKLATEVAVRRGLGVHRALQSRSRIIAAGRRSKMSSTAISIWLTGTCSVPNVST